MTPSPSLKIYQTKKQTKLSKLFSFIRKMAPVILCIGLIILFRPLASNASNFNFIKKLRGGDIPLDQIKKQGSKVIEETAQTTSEDFLKGKGFDYRSFTTKKNTAKRLAQEAAAQLRKTTKVIRKTTSTKTVFPIIKVDILKLQEQIARQNLTSNAFPKENVLKLNSTSRIARKVTLNEVSPEVLKHIKNNWNFIHIANFLAIKRNLTNLKSVLNIRGLV